MPSQRFGVNAAWFKLTLLTYNLVSAIKGLSFEPQERTVRMKQFRILLVNLMGRMNRKQLRDGLAAVYHADGPGQDAASVGGI